MSGQHKPHGETQNLCGPTTESDAAMMEEIKAAITKDPTKSFCCQCGKEMRFNVPRLGKDGGFVHSETGKLLCYPGETGHSWIMREMTEEELKNTEDNND